MAKKKTGTLEWAGDTMNIQIGCEHGCRYCYAAELAIKQYGYCISQEAWLDPIINQKKVDLPHKRKYPDGVMFPSTHNITPRNLSEYLCVLRKLLDAGNQVLIVTKPHYDCVSVICEGYKSYIDQITFRFTIGSIRNDILKFWEPGAPSYLERMSCLEYAFSSGFRTSVSCEPMLDAWPHHVYAAVEEQVTDTIWFGKMRNMNSRVDFKAMTKKQQQLYVVPLMKAQQDSVILGYVAMMKDWPKVRFKDSIQEVIDKAVK